MRRSSLHREFFVCLFPFGDTDVRLVACPPPTNDSMALAALIVMNESKEKPAPPKYPKKTYEIFDDPDVRLRWPVLFCPV